MWIVVGGTWGRGTGVWSIPWKPGGEGQPLVEEYCCAGKPWHLGGWHGDGDGGDATEWCG